MGIEITWASKNGSQILLDERTPMDRVVRWVGAHTINDAVRRHTPYGSLQSLYTLVGYRESKRILPGKKIVKEVALPQEKEAFVVQIVLGALQSKMASEQHVIKVDFANRIKRS